MFLFKKLVSSLLMPLPFCLGMIVIGLCLLWFTRRQRTGKVLILMATIGLLGLSCAAISGKLLRPIEQEYPPMISTADNGATRQAPRYIVVLGAGHRSDPNLPATSKLTHATLARLVEGIRLHKEIPGSKLVLSGGEALGSGTDAEAMAELARSLGVKQQDLILESESKDTEDEARLLEPIVKTDPFILVTSAYHMKRSVSLMRKLGLNPIPAPTDHLAIGEANTQVADLFPDSRGLTKSERAVHEYLGIIWSKLRGKL
jgi:uncharacterized SAM-binding protein YcdF (DUF218 family)